MREVVVSVTEFRKTYDDVVAVDGISFEVRRGEIFGLLGPNGAGKTTTLECLEGIRQPDGGTLSVLGVDPSRQAARLRNLIGVQLQVAGLPANMKAEEAMRFFCSYHQVSPRYDLLDRMGLGEKRNAQYYELSTGQKRRLALALAVAHEPPVVFLDEPTAGLDVGSRAELHALAQELRDEGSAVILATHDMAEAEKMTDRVAILLLGKIVAAGSPRELTATGSGFTKVSVRTEDNTLVDESVVFPAASQRTVKDEYVIYYSTDPAPTVSGVLEYIKNRDDNLIDLRVERPSLEERFLEITAQGGVS
jgi:ABC-2 type transport system ATP-binding protein